MERALTLHFVDGTKISFDFDAQAPNVHARNVKLVDLPFLDTQSITWRCRARDRAGAHPPVIPTNPGEPT